jgi:hypothetical protein
MRSALWLTGGGTALPELVLAYAWVWLGLRRRSLAELSSESRPASAEAETMEATTQLIRLRQLTDLVLQRRPFRASCLVRALVLQRLLRRRGVATQLVITVARAGSGLRGHAETRLRSASDPAPVLLEQPS